MALSRPSWLALVAGIVAGLAIVATLIITPPRANSPVLAAPGSHFQVSAADSAHGPVDVGNGNAVGGAIRHDTSRPLKDMEQLPVRALPAEEHPGEDADRQEPHAVVQDPVVQTNQVSANMPATSLSFDGIGFPGVSCNCAPPDTNGEVGATQYVQIVNEGYQVFDKSTGASVLGPASISSVWGGFGGVCQANGDGDPVVVYDQLADRWLISQFAGAGTPTDECVAVSTTSDATGSWNRYDFHLGSNFYDYPKISVWPDGYYMSINVFNSSGTLFLGPQAFVMDRANMLAGTNATFQAAANLGPTYSPMLPADVEGSTPPPAGAAEPFVLYPDSGAPVNGKYLTYRYHVDWVTPANSTFTSVTSPSAAGYTQACSACVAQPGTTSTLDTLGDRLMFRLTYRKFADHEMLLGSYTVASGGVLGVRWFELRNITSGTESVFQESTYQPDSTYRWMPSAAMDASGDIAVGYSASSSSVVPALRYAGRLASDPIGTLGQGEAVLFAGQGSQSGTSSRWGDYSDMTVDPVDGCTFWFTSEYYPAGVSGFNWRTRIGSFSFPGCGGSPTTGSISGHVTDASTHAAISGATVSISGGGSTSTDAAGAYSFSSVAAGSYSLTASKSGYVSGTNNPVTVTAGSNTTSDFALSAVAGSTSTPFVFATSSAAGTGGDGNGYETNRSALWGATDGVFASDVNSGTASGTTCTSTARDSEATSGYALGSLGSSILGIRVQVVGKASSNGNSPKLCVQLSSDGGATWTAGKISGALKTTAQTFTLGSSSDLWGGSWTAASFGSGFRVRVIDLASSTARTFSLDSVSVSVTYQ